jgi:hypothetical protein
MSLGGGRASHSVLAALMPIHVFMRDALTGEESEPLLDPTYALHRVLPDKIDSEFPLLSRIDWYDEVEFTSSEVSGLLDEVDLLMKRVIGPDDLSYVKELRALMESCRAKPRCRLTFYGD